MKVRFLSSVPCSLTVGGNYFGVTDRFPRYTDIQIKDNLFVCFSPQSALPLGVFLNEQLFFSPPDGIEVYLLKDGAAVFARDFPARSFSIRTIAQERFVDDLVTVYFQGSVFISLETSAGFFLHPLSSQYENALIKKRNELFFVEGRDALCIFNRRGEKLFDKEVSNYETEAGALKTVSILRLGSTGEREKSNDENGVILREEFALTESGCFPVRNATTIQNASLFKGAFPAHDFFELFRHGANVLDFLTDDLKNDADTLRAFLGKFEYVFPCDDENECGVLRKRGERLYEAEYYRLEYRNDEISDVKKL